MEINENIIVPLSIGNLTIKQAKEIIKNQNKDNTTWLSVPESTSNIIQSLVNNLKIRLGK